ncbi:MAG: hypothetical protein F6J87_19840 [Spirulina sp. SIO3F2]|nr:hypothetical protein [Spirulina sp. SIO3F2]
MESSPESPPPPVGNAQNSNGKVLWRWLGGLGCGCLVLGLVVMFGLPLLFTKANKAKVAIPESHISRLLQTQWLYHAETGEFAPSLMILSQYGNPLGELRTEDDLYRYEILPSTQPQTAVYLLAVPHRSRTLLFRFKSYSGALFIVPVPDGEKPTTTVQAVCQSKRPTTRPLELPTLAANQIDVNCPPGSIQLQSL